MGNIKVDFNYNRIVGVLKNVRASATALLEWCDDLEKELDNAGREIENQKADYKRFVDGRRCNPQEPNNPEGNPVRHESDG